MTCRENLVLSLVCKVGRSPVFQSDATAGSDVIDQFPGAVFRRRDRFPTAMPGRRIALHIEKFFDYSNFASVYQPGDRRFLRCCVY